MQTDDSNRMESLKDQIHQILVSNMTPLQEKLRSHALQNSSIEQLFGVVADEYREKQNQVTTIGKLILHTIDLLTEQVGEKNELARDYQQTIDDYRTQQESCNTHIEQCEAALEDYKDKIEQLELELEEVKQIREKYQSMYQQQHSKVAGQTFDSYKQADSMEMERVQVQHNSAQIDLLEYEIKQLKLNLSHRDAQMAQKQQLKNNLNERLKSEVQKNQALQGTFRVLQENFRGLVEQNSEFRRIIEETENKNRELKRMDRRNRHNSFDRSETPSLAREKSEMNMEESQDQLLLGKSVSQSLMRKKASEVISISQPRKSLAFDLQNLQSQTSMVSPKASEAGRGNNTSLFMANRDKLKKAAVGKSPLSVRSRRSSRCASEISKSPHRHTGLSKRVGGNKSAGTPFLRWCVIGLLDMAVSRRIRK